MAERVELHLKYRPKTFDELIGYRVLKESLLAAIPRSRTFLFYGPRGCGKTTIARLIGNHINVAPIDFCEIDAADNTGIDNARAIKEAAQYSPLGGKFKIYIIDECHRLSGAASDSLLKTLENPPQHCYFVLCTTELQKVSATMKSRCKCYEVQPLTEDEQKFLIKWVCHEEGFKVSPTVRQTIVESCEGIPREILVTLDTVRGVENDEDAISLIRSAVHKEVIDLCRALLDQRKWSEVAVILKALKDDPERVRMAILGYMNSVLLSANPKNMELAAGLIKNFQDSYMYIGKAGLTKDCFYSVT